MTTPGLPARGDASPENASPNGAKAADKTADKTADGKGGESSASDYNEESIQVLKGLEAVRKWIGELKLDSRPTQ